MNLSANLKRGKPDNGLENEGEGVGVRPQAGKRNFVIKKDGLRRREELDHGVIKIYIGLCFMCKDGTGVTRETQRKAGLNKMGEKKVVLMKTSSNHRAMSLVDMSEAGALPVPEEGDKMWGKSHGQARMNLLNFLERVIFVKSESSTLIQVKNLQLRVRSYCVFNKKQLIFFQFLSLLGSWEGTVSL